MTTRASFRRGLGVALAVLCACGIMTAGGSAEASPQPPNAAPAAPAEGRKPPARPKPKLNAPDRRDPKMPDSMDAPPPVKPRVGPALPVLLVDRDNVKIESSCIVKIPADTIIVDADGDGVIQVVKPDVIVEFEQGSVLRGAMAQADPEMRRGFGVRVQGVSGVSLRNVQAEGYLAGIFATRADGLVVESSSFRELRRDVLKSTPQAEDTRDWLSPHRNDMNEWLTNYGAAVYIEDSQGVTVRNVTVRNNQNGIVLDRVTKSKVYDNDCSFLTGWGVALWRSSDNVVARNSLDFCVRGYSHQMYNRGQDSAGLLMFEQCSRNIIAENSATHCGDGLFVFAGNEALGENAKPGEAFDTTGKGCNENLIIGNDFSYSAAHGLEITFSFNNRIVSNRLVGNAICGLWGGYSQNTLILANTITHNGIEGAKEGGGINIEHGHANTIAQNIMGNNSVAISLWWDDDAKLLQSPWAKANHKGSSDNRVLVNSFANEPVPLRLRATTGTRVGANTYEESPEAVDRDDGSNVISLEPGEAPPEFDVLVAKDLPGERVAVGGRRALEGRENIILTRDGPWDHMRTLVRLFKSTPDTDEYEVYRLADRAVVNIVGISDETNAELVPEANLDYPLAGERFRRLTVTAPRPGIYPYRLTFDGRGFKATIPGVLNALKWDTTFFVLDDTFAKAVGPDERRASFDALAAAANSKLKSSEKPFIAGSCAQAELRTLDLPFGVGGPSELKLDPVVTEAALPKDNFGMVATTKLTLPPGSYRATFAFDDGLELTIVVGEGAGAKTMTFGGEWGRSDPVNNVADFDVPGEAKQAVPVTMNVKYYDVHGPGELRLRFLPNWP